MHLATAAGTRVIALFSVTKADNYGPLGEGCVSLRSGAGPDAIAMETIATVAG